ncbi:HAD family hydrolase [Anaerocolumna sp.]|uniref:HAD family hydrolase n=1 Tax=Anaerocolumna sp. TaxID=2041569 RepID=UPI0028A93F6A|nr:HAD family phosphatase [Anaerocolumna sp.]
MHWKNSENKYINLAYKAVIFDMDGTMLDTERLASIAWKRAGEELNYPITEEILSQVRGRNLTDSIRIFSEIFGTDQVYKNAKVLRDRYVADMIKQDGVPTKKGLFELLSFLKDTNIKMAVATSSKSEIAKKHLTGVGIYNYFEAHIYGDMVAKSKPNPEIFLLAARELKVETHECLVLEDSKSGIRAGKNAGMYSILIPDMTPPDKEMAEDASLICKDLMEVLEILKNSIE